MEQTDYTDVHKCILQYAMTSGSVETHHLQTIMRSCTDDESHSRETLDQIISQINRKISPYHQEIVKRTCEFTKKQYYIMLNTGQEEMFKFQGNLKMDDYEPIRGLIQSIIKSSNKQLPMELCLSYLGNNARAEHILDVLVKSSYLHKTNDSICFGARLVYDCERYLRNVFPDDVFECGICREIVIKKNTCALCGAIFHSHCLEKCLSRVNKCPSCKSGWVQV